MNFKKIISLLLAVCLVMGVAVGCGTSQETAPQNETSQGLNVNEENNAEENSTNASSEPTDTPNEQVETPSEPDKTPGESTDTPSEPADTPSEPTDTPSEPADTPSEPADTSSESSQPDNSVTNEKKMIQNKELKKVLMIGHSFALNSAQYVSQMVADFGGNLEITVLHYPGCTLEEHYNFYKNDEAVFQVYKNGYQMTTESVTSKSVLEGDKYDYITFQGHSVKMDDISTYEKLVPLWEIVKKHQPQAQFMIHQTWSLCWRRNLGAYPAKNIGRDQFTKVEECFNEAAKRIGGVPIVAVGEAIQIAKESGDFSNDYGKRTSLYADEVSHLSEKGKYLAACVWAQFMYKDEIDIRQNTFSGAGVSVTDREKLAEIAYKVVMEK